jgi:hypothetical protein
MACNCKSPRPVGSPKKVVPDVKPEWVLKEGVKKEGIAESKNTLPQRIIKFL